MRNTQEKSVVWLESKETRVVFIVKGEEVKISTHKLLTGRLTDDDETMTRPQARILYSTLVKGGYKRTR